MTSTSRRASGLLLSVILLSMLALQAVISGTALSESHFSSLIMATITERRASVSEGGDRLRSSAWRVRVEAREESSSK